MRLDHLLSKEHLQSSLLAGLPEPLPGHPAYSGRPWPGWSARGWNVDDVLPDRSGESVRPACGSGSLAGVGMVACTLLGPEGSTPVGGMEVLVAGSVSRTSSALGWSGQRGECRPYVENYTVDASIFDPAP